jgi:hypothetical protein
LKNRRFISFIIILCLAFSCSAQQAGVNAIDTSDWSGITLGTTFNEQQQKISRRGSPALPQLTYLQNMKYVLLTLVLVLIASLVIYAIRMQRGGIKKDESLNWDEIENLDEVREKDLLSELEKSLAAGDYRSAIRLRFLIILKDLVGQNLITWRKEKTNSDYRYELAGHNTSASFNQAAYVFDLVWYGEREANADLYSQVNEVHKQINGIVNQLQ